MEGGILDDFVQPVGNHDCFGFLESWHMAQPPSPAQAFFNVSAVLRPCLAALVEMQSEIRNRARTSEMEQFQQVINCALRPSQCHGLKFHARTCFHMVDTLSKIAKTSGSRSIFFCSGSRIESTAGYPYATR